MLQGGDFTRGNVRYHLHTELIDNC
jgi:hypothetical protein